MTVSTGGTWGQLSAGTFGKVFPGKQVELLSASTGSAERQIASVRKAGRSLPTLAKTLAKQLCSYL